MKVVALFGALTALSLGGFLLVPNLDLATSRLFYDPQQGFVPADWPPLSLLEGSVRWITWGLVGIVAAGALRLWLTGRPLWRLDRNALIFLVASLAIGPGLIVNTGLKDHWGRARPYQVVQFGGPKEFSPAPLPSTQCEQNCSFVSGHAALGFSLVSFGFLLPAGRRRRLAIAAAIGLGGLVGLGRIAAGRHFLSDIVDAGLIVFATSWLLHRWIVVHDGLAPLRALVGRFQASPLGRAVIWTAAIAALEAAAIGWIDRPLAYFLHTSAAAWRPIFAATGRFGEGYPYLVLCALGFAVLRWGGSLPPLRAWAASMRAASVVPGFLFAAIAASGLIVDLLKVVFGRTRPKLLFADGLYNFTWFGWRADHWSFPSGHAATVAALMTALWCLWPRPIVFYVAGATLIAVSRLVTGAHYLSDVVAGGFIAILATRALAAWIAPQRIVAGAERAHLPEPAMRAP